MVDGKGFTLVEILIVIAIIGILMTIAYPSYMQYIVKSNRTDVQSELVRVASLLQRYKMLNSTYLKSEQPLTLSDLGVSKDYPSPTKKLYELEMTNVTAGTWTLRAVPKGTQLGNGDVVLNHNNQKCWTKGSSCVPSATTNWDNK